MKYYETKHLQKLLRSSLCVGHQPLAMGSALWCYLYTSETPLEKTAFLFSFVLFCLCP